jgi:5'-nucleotidase
MLKEERMKDADLLLLDCGDFSQGSPYYTLFKGDVEVKLMNRMKYDAATIGNHEFDFGLENMARIFREAQFPIVCSNYDFTGTPVEGLTKPYIILNRKGVKIGIFGVCPEMKGLVDERKCEGVKYLDPKAVAKQMAEKLRKEEKCDIVVCLSHLGWQIGGDDDNAMIAASKDIDIVLGGHSHTYLKQLGYVNDADGKAVPVDHNGKNAIFVGKIKIQLEK